jgi:hypothetical protein
MKLVPPGVTVPTSHSRAKVLIRLRASVLIRKTSDPTQMFSIEQCQIVTSITMIAIHLAKLLGSGRFPIKDIEE